MTPVLPTAVTDHRASGVLAITWSDGTLSRLGHGLLRASCRCATCEQQRRHGTGIPTSDASVRIVGIEPVGEQALNLAFSDGHDRGIYPFAYLRQLGAA